MTQYLLRSGENHAVMKKTFWYLIFMVIILPTFSLTSGQGCIFFGLSDMRFLMVWEHTG